MRTSIGGKVNRFFVETIPLLNVIHRWRRCRVIFNRCASLHFSVLERSGPGLRKHGKYTVISQVSKSLLYFYSENEKEISHKSGSKETLKWCKNLGFLFTVQRNESQLPHRMHLLNFHLCRNFFAVLLPPDLIGSCVSRATLQRTRGGLWNLHGVLRKFPGQCQTFGPVDEGPAGVVQGTTNGGRPFLTTGHVPTQTDSNASSSTICCCKSCSTTATRTPRDGSVLSRRTKPCVGSRKPSTRCRIKRSGKSDWKNWSSD